MFMVNDLSDQLRAISFQLYLGAKDLQDLHDLHDLHDLKELYDLLHSNRV